ncbi:MAG: hypothetical protein LBQ06_01480 [Frankiaceae bacterium]|jgi:hypothetical protein|nr:hypothetical protein [Frankiaceae bacterium]
MTDVPVDPYRYADYRRPSEDFDPNAPAPAEDGDRPEPPFRPNVIVMPVA